MPEHVTISITDLKPGWKVDYDIYSPDMALLVSAGVTLTAGIIQSFRRREITSFRVSSRSVLSRRNSSDTPDETLQRLLDNPADVYETHGLETAIPQTVLEAATDQMEEFFKEIELGGEVDYDSIRQLTSQLVTVFTARANLAVKLLDLDRFDRYTYRHSLNVGMLYMLIASNWVSNSDKLEELVFGALLHDMGKARVGADIINKPGKLTDDEWGIMRRHPVWSAEMLADIDATPTAIRIARSHHEKLNGKGYPDGLRGDQMDRYVFLAAICDVYDALTTKRSYKRKMDFGKAIDIILQDCGSHFHPGTANEFIRAVGRYPAGCFVRLSSNEVAVVLRVNENAISRPVVSRVLNSDGSECAQAEELDLSQQNELFITELVISSQPGRAGAV